MTLASAKQDGVDLALTLVAVQLALPRPTGLQDKADRDQLMMEATEGVRTAEASIFAAGFLSALMANLFRTVTGLDGDDVLAEWAEFVAPWRDGF